jgi:Cu(I)/Ag(I) efflux system membrane fusion protein
MKKITSNKYFLFALILVIGALIGWLIKPSASSSVEPSDHQHTEVSEAEIWTCSMHPQIRRNGPGKCPICGMDLIPVESGETSEMDPMAISMSPTAMQLAQVRVEKVGKSTPNKFVRLNGKVQEDERLVFSQSSHIPGRIEKLAVNFTGEYVRKGQPIAYIYSPELVTAQEELFQAKKISATQPQLYAAAKDKLKNWKLTDAQIQSIIQSGETKEEFPVMADISGYVIEKMVNLGDYIGRGEPIYEIANLSKVWVLFDVYESDMPWIKRGDKVSFTVASFPGEEFEGKISFIDPVIDPQTRVAKARLEVANKGLKLKPEMFVSGTVEATIPSKSDALVVPKTAVMWTGERSVVYVKSQSPQGVSFMMREVTLGPALGESFIVENGLEEGEEIVVNGTFSVDAAAQLAGKPSMMSPEGGGGNTMPGMPGMKMGSESDIPETQIKTEKFIEGKAYDFRKQTPEVFRKQLDEVIDAYLNLKDGLVAADKNETAKYSSALSGALQKVNGDVLQGDAKAFWDEKKSFLMQHARLGKEAPSMAGKRENFIYLSQPLIKIVEAFGPGNEKLYVDYCQMANDKKGAYWLSESEEIRNPFMPEEMRTCGEVKQEISAND